MQVECLQNFDITKLTSLKIGGEVRKIYFPKSVLEFEEIACKEKEFKIFGNFSNTLVSSDGWEGVVVVTSKMDRVEIDGNRVFAECGVKGPKLAQIVSKHGLSGFEFMIGFPGSLGGNVFMNASAHSQCISDKLQKVLCFSEAGGVFELTKDEMEFSYRTSRCQRENIVVLGAEFVLEQKSAEEILQKMNENLEFRKTHQPSLALPNCGSVFRNPEGNSAGKLLESIGAKDFCVGDAKVWENHANFIINTKNATSEQFLNLMLKMRDGVKNKYGIELMPEVRYLGNRNKNEVELCKILNVK